MSRRLGYWETFKKLTHDLSFNSESIAAGIELQGDVSFEKLKKALKKIVAAQALLRARIISEGKDNFFSFDVNFDDLPILRKQATSANAWLELVDEQMNQPFPIDQYLWRFTLLEPVHGERQNFAIVCSFHHSISDGISVMAFFDQVLAYYANEDDSFLYTTNSEPTSVEARLKRHWPLERYKSEMPSSSVSFTAAPYQKFARLTQRATKTLAVYLTPDLSDQLQAYAQKIKSTSHNLLAANMLISAHKILARPITLNMSTPVSLRDFCDPKINKNEIGCFVSVVNTIYENIDSASTLRELAGEYQQKLIKAVPKYIRLPQAYEVREVIDIYGLDKLAEKTKFDLALAITDIKETNLKNRYGALTITNQIAGVNLNYGLVTMLLGVGIFDGRFMLCFNYVEPLISKNWAQHFINVFVENLNDEISKLL